MNVDWICNRAIFSVVDSHQGELADVIACVQENPAAQPYQETIPRPSSDANSSAHAPPFPTLDAQKINDIIQEGLAKLSIKSKYMYIAA